MKSNTMTACITSALLAVGCGESKVETPAPISTVSAAEEIRIVGSSTVYPFSTKVAQEFKNKTGHSVVVESTGSGGGHKLFCAGAGSPDVTNSSRRQKKSEFELCATNGVDQIVEVKIGYDGIVLANAIDGAVIDFTLKQIYQAFAKQVPVSDEDCTMQDNPYQQWSDIDADLPDAKIEAYGPPPTSGTRDAFVEIAMEGGAQQFGCLAALKNEDGERFKAISHTLREDGNWIDAGENDNAIVQTLTNTPSAVGVFGYSFLDQNADMVKGALVGGVEPTFENIAAGEYPISRSLYFYVKADNVGVTNGLKEYALEFTSEEAWGPGGYLEDIGLVPLADAERAQYRNDVEMMRGYRQ